MERGGPLERRTPLRRTGFNQRQRTPLKRTPLKRTAPHRVDPELREAARQRDGGCRLKAVVPEHRCWGRLDPHHVWPRGKGGPDTLENLATLCRAAHRWVHDEDPKRARALGLLR